jgi:polar amino acid transport system substrate-binding protein
MKRLPVVAATLAALAVVAASAGARTSSTAAPPDTKTPGKLTVGLSLPAVGFQSGTVRGTKVSNPKGFEIDLARAVATKLGFKTSDIVWYNNSNFSTIYAPAPKKWDFAFAEVTITAARAKNVDFSTPYFKANQGVMVRKGLSPTPKTIADLKKLHLCAQTGTTGADYIRTKIKPAKADYPSTTVIMFQEVENGQCDATVYDTPIIASQRKSKPSAYGPIVGTIITNENYGAVFEKGSKLRSPFNSAITALTKNGTIAKLQKKWFNLNFSSLPVIK